MTSMLEKEKTISDCMIMNFWSCHNYGALLTCFGVQELIKRCGLSCQIINYFPHPYFIKKYKGSFTEDFATKYFNLTHQCYNYQDLKELNDYAKVFIAGSDQIWNTEIVRNHHYNVAKTVWLLDFVSDKNKKISYSPSFGTSKFIGTIQEKLNFEYFIKQFDSVSIREVEGVEILEKEFHINATQLIDGAFLIPKEKLNKMTQEYKSEEDYIACFCLFKNDNWSKKYIDDIQKQSKLKVKCFNFDYKIPVEEWLAFIKNSKLVIADSYHAIVFAIIFNVPFVQIKNSNTQSRFSSLFKLLNIQDYSIDKNSKNININNIINAVNWDETNQIIEKKVFEAECWIKQALSKPKTQKEIINILNDSVISKQIMEVDFEQTLGLIIAQNSINRNYYKYKLLSKISFGKRKQYYKEKKNKYKMMRNKLKKIMENNIY